MIDGNDPFGLLRLLPRVRRARGFRLYMETGRRLVDLWQYGGAAALGHTPSAVLLTFKDVASRGIFGPFPSAYERRFSQALASLMPDRKRVRWYSGREEADRALRGAGFPDARFEDFVDPAFSDPGNGCIASLWRPWLGPMTFPSVVAPVIPLPYPARPIAFLLADSVAERFPPSSTLSPVVLAAASRALADLVSRAPHEMRYPSPVLARAISSAGLVSRGPYLRFSESSDESAYRGLFKRFLDSGFLLPPDPALPAILPDDLSRGEERALSAAFGAA